MPTLAGIDGCREGWLCVFEELPSHQLASKIFPTIDDFARHLAHLDVVAIDIPIGLTDGGPRACDVDARRLLAPARSNSVFPAPIRPALHATSYADACARSLDAQGKKLSQQSWAIYPKIREVDALLRSRPDLHAKIFEVHPELTFRAWNAGTPMQAKKKSREGKEQRLALVTSHFGPHAFANVRNRYTRRNVADDDILDAFAALWTAERIHAGIATTVPDATPADSEGVPMRMVY